MGVFTFITAKGRYAVTTKHCASLTTYTGDEIDLLACVALPLDKVLFVPTSRVTKTKITLIESLFTVDNAAVDSFNAGLKELKII